MSAPSKIKKLNEVVVNRIAAGEVIQRPSNALKELIENCLDAKSTNIQIIVKEGGLKLLQIQDNGTGIRKEDMEIVCERFTTSKLEKIEDLQSLTTFGFRGEALASISHVAQLTITTKTIDEKCAYKASYCDGKLKAAPVSCAGNQGTTITVENLFYNVPTRKKALSSASEEFSKIVEVVTKYSIHNQSVGFNLKKHGESRTHVRTPHLSTKTNNIKLLYGNEVARDLLEVEMKHTKYNFKMHALITNPNYSNKRLIFLLFINHRLVESSMLKKMLEDLYSVHLPKKTHPWCYLALEIDPANIDVNVHPTKHEVRFLHEDSIIEKVKIALDEKLSQVSASRTFYMQSKLPNVDITRKVLEQVLPEYDAKQTERVKKPYAHEMIRTNPTDQKLDRFSFTINSSFEHSKLDIKEKLKEENMRLITIEKRQVEENISQREKGRKENEAEIESCNDKEKEKIEIEKINMEKTKQDIACKNDEGFDDKQRRIQIISVREAEEKGANSDELKIDEACDNSTCFLITDQDDKVSETNKPFDMQLDSDESSAIADKALERIYKYWGNQRNEKESEERKVLRISSSDDKINENNTSRKIESDKQQTAIAEFKSYSVNDFKREIKLKSILNLRKEVENNYHSGLRVILSNLTFIGCIDEVFALIQSGFNLYICNTKKLAEELFYEIMLYDFGNFGVIKFSESLPLHDLAMLGLETEDAGWTEEDGSKEELASRAQEILLEKAEMMKEYFAITIDEKGNLKSLPILLSNYYPNEAAIPLFILRLATEVDWSTEKPCLQSICRETAKLYCQVDSQSEIYNWKHVTEHIFYNAIKESLLPPKYFAHDSSILELASITDLYKVFERC